jgi:hypothetical protein
MESQELPAVGFESAAENGRKEDSAVLGQLRKKRNAVQPFGKTVTLEVPGYDHCLGIEYVYIDADVTEEIGNRVAKELRPLNGKGENFLSSIETLLAACKQVMIRESANEPWRPIDTSRPVRFESKLAELLDFDADDAREVCIGVFGSEHAIIQQNIILSRWLTDITRDVEADFLGA